MAAAQGIEPALPELPGTRRLRATPADIDRMRSSLFLTEGQDSNRKLSKFWVLIVLSAIIASAGVIADSTATVIGAMIVAPLMTPILGTALSVVLSVRRLIILNIGLVLAGAVIVIAIGYLLGLTAPTPLTAESSSQIASRISPRLIDLVAALATGVVGAFATVRADISDTLPGVAIAISLVPPLAVVGLTLESVQLDEAMGALLLFGTNVSAIIATGTIIFLIYRVRSAAAELGMRLGQFKVKTVAVVVGAVLVLTVPLALGSTAVVQRELTVSRAQQPATEWAEAQGWQITDISYRQGMLRIVALGPPPEILETGLRERLDAAGLKDVDVRVTLVFGGSQDIPASG